MLELDGLDRAAAQAEVERIAREVLTNPVIEEFRFEIVEDALRPRQAAPFWRLDLIPLSNPGSARLRLTCNGTLLPDLAAPPSCV